MNKSDKNSPIIESKTKKIWQFTDMCITGISLKLVALIKISSVCNVLNLKSLLFNRNI